ncbi:MAG: hypothetical protein ACYC3P_08520 [Bellilinea sp.]
MKKILFSGLIALALIFSTISSPVQALPGGSWSSGIKIQNLDGSAPANLSVNLYSAAGTLVTTITTTSNGNPLSTPVGGSVELYMPAYSSVASGLYSAVVTSTTAVSGVVTSTNYEYGMADSYTSMLPAKNITIPYTYRNHNSYSTEITLQNTTSVSTNVTVTFKEPSSSIAYSDSGLHEKIVNFSIPANGSKSLDTTAVDFNDLGWFIGAATISSEQDLTAVANQYRVVGAGDTPGNLMISSRGLINLDSGVKLVVPSLYKEFSGSNGTWRSGIKIQNQNSSIANVTVVFKSDPDMPAWTGTKTLSINPNDSAELFLPGILLDSNNPIPNMFKGSAVITANVALVANVQHTNYSGANGFGVGMGYTAFSSGGTKLSLPSLYNWPSGAGVWVSGIKVQNLGATSVTIKATFVPDPDSVSQFTGTATNISLPGNSAKELFFGSAFLDGGNFIPSSWKGSAVIEVTAGASTIAATIIHTNYGRHVASMYTAMVVPAP